MLILNPQSHEMLRLLRIHHESQFNAGQKERLPTSAAAPKLVPILSLLLASRTKAAYTNSRVSAARGSTHAEGAHTQGTQGEMRKTDASSPEAANGSSHNNLSDPPTNPKAPSHKESEALGASSHLPGDQDNDSHLADDSAAQSLMIVNVLLRLLPVAEVTLLDLTRWSSKACLELDLEQRVWRTRTVSSLPRCDSLGVSKPGKGCKV